uniref:RPA1 related single stranded DNA binding protein, X-linked n=1 Tax=Ornithorhynchus anatinus TaxID=9258 RepID=A0A6I8PHL4_ORNAN
MGPGRRGRQGVGRASASSWSPMQRARRPGRGRAEAEAEAGAAREAALGEAGSWLQRVARRVTAAPHLRAALQDAGPVWVLAVQRYLAEPGPARAPPPPPPPPPPPGYCYDVTLSDGLWQEKCHLVPELNGLVQKNILRAGIEVRVRTVSCLYNEKKLDTGILCLESLDCGGAAAPDPRQAPFRQKEQGRRPERPLKGGRTHYLPLWNNEDPYGDLWLGRKQPDPRPVDVSRITSVAHLEMTWMSRINFSPLLVRIMYKSRLRYYGKPEKNLDEPYQAYLEVADSSGMVSVILWNTLCPEWYNSLSVGTVILIQQYTIKKSYPFRTQPSLGNSQMKRISTIEICLNLQDPSTKISIIPENLVKPEWRLPEVMYNFIARSELDKLPNNYSCDIIGLVTFVGRAQRTKKKESSEDFWLYRWVHVVDGTADEPFILELFATSQPDIFEHIHPMTYLVCTQVRVVRDDTQPPNTRYLTTSNESQIFITGYHKGQPYTSDAKVKSFIQWTKTQSENDQIKKTIIGGYYPFPPAPDTFLKYCNCIKVESVLTALSELKGKIEALHYREHKRIAIQGIISAIRYVGCSSTPEDGSEVGTVQEHSYPSKSQAVEETDFQSEESEVQKEDSRCHQDKEIKFVLNSQENDLEEPHYQSSTASCSPVQRKKMKQRLGDKSALPTQEDNWAEEENRLTVRDTSQLCRDEESMNDEPAIEETRELYSESWESHLWTEQYNLHPAKYQPKQYSTNKEIHEFKDARGLGHYEITVLGLNHKIAIDVAFLPTFSLEDPQLSVGEDLHRDSLLSCMDWNSVSHSETFSSKRLQSATSFPGEIIKAATDLDRVHIVCILDICHLGEDRVEVFLNKIYRPADTA